MMKEWIAALLIMGITFVVATISSGRSSSVTVACYCIIIVALGISIWIVERNRPRP